MGGIRTRLWNKISVQPQNGLPENGDSMKFFSLNYSFLHEMSLDRPFLKTLNCSQLLSIIYAILKMETVILRISHV